MTEIFSEYLDSSYMYNYSNGPDVIKTESQAARNGLNCIALVHLILKRLFSTELPSNLKAWEMYRNNPYFEDVSALDKLIQGDIIFFGKKELSEYVLNYTPKYDISKHLINEDEGRALIGAKYTGLHLAMYTGELAKDGSPLFIHANKITAGVAIWPLREFLALDKYSTIHKIKRLIAPYLSAHEKLE